MTGQGRGDVEGLAEAGHEHGAGRLEGRVGLPQGVELLADGQEPFRSGLPAESPWAPSPCSMISSTAARAESRWVTATSCGQWNSSGVAWARGEPTNRARSPSRRGKRPQPVGDAPVEMPDGHEFLTPRQGLVLVDRVTGRSGGDELGSVRAVHAFGAFEEREMIEGPLAERQQVELHIGGEVAGPLREVGSPEPGAAPIADIRFATRAMCSISSMAMPRSFLRHRSTASACSGQAIGDTVLEAELCEQVLAHDHVLELQRSASSHHRCSRSATTTLGSDHPEEEVRRSATRPCVSIVASLLGGAGPWYARVVAPPFAPGRSGRLRRTPNPPEVPTARHAELGEPQPTVAGAAAQRSLGRGRSGPAIPPARRRPWAPDVREANPGHTAPEPSVFAWRSAQSTA